jgi:hypothetical protein
MNGRNKILKVRLKTEGNIVLPLKGRCMEPLLIAGDKVKIIPASHYTSGYLYLFELLDGTLAVHRLVGKTEEFVLLKGDRSRGFETVPYKNIIGLVSEVRLFNRTQWINIYSYRRSMAIITYLSKKRMKDKNMGDETMFHRILDRFYALFLIVYSYFIRKWWETYPQN